MILKLIYDYNNININNNIFCDVILNGKGK